MKRAVGTAVLACLMFALAGMVQTREAAAVYLGEVRFFDVETGETVNTTDTASGFVMKMNDTDYPAGINDVKSVQVKMPKGVYMNSKEDLSPGTVIGKSKAFVSWLCENDAWGNVKVWSAEPGEPLEFKIHLKADCWFGDITQDIFMYAGVDEDMRITTGTGYMPTSGLDLAANFDSFRITINKPIFKTPHKCGTYTTDVKYFEWTPKDWDTKSKSQVIDKWCGNYYPDPQPVIDKLEAVPDKAADNPTINLTVKREQSDHVPLGGMVLRLGQGWTGNIFAIPDEDRCTKQEAESGNIPSSKLVGTGSFKVQLSATLPLTGANADICLSKEKGDSSKIARLYIVSKLPAIVFPDNEGEAAVLVLDADLRLHNPLPFNSMEADYRIVIDTKGIPSEFDIREFKISSWGWLGKGVKRLLTSPTQCSGSDFMVRLNSADGPGFYTNDTKAIKPTGCSDTYPPYYPTIDLDLESTAPGNTGGMKVTFNQDYDNMYQYQAHTKNATIVFPEGITPVSTKDIVASGGTLGDVKAYSPISDKPFTGKLKLLTSVVPYSIAQLKSLPGTIMLEGEINGSKIKVPLNVDFSIGEGYRLNARIKDAYELPLSKMEIDIPAGILRVGDICKSYEMEGYFLSHNLSNLKQPWVKDEDTVTVSGSTQQCNAVKTQPKPPKIITSPWMALIGGKALSHPQSFDVGIERDSSDHAQFKKLALRMPKGFMASPAATGGKYCNYKQQWLSQDCDESTLIGSGTVSVQVFDGLPHAAVPFELHMAKPFGPKQGAALVVLKESELTDGQDFVFKADIEMSKKTGYLIELSTDALNTGLDIRKVDFELNGQKGAQSGNELLTIQPHCKEAGISGYLTGVKTEGVNFFDGINSEEGYGTLKATGCPVPFAPKLKQTFKPPKAFAKPKYSLEITQQKDEAHIKKATILLDKKIDLESISSVKPCPLKSATEWPPDGCSEASKIGSVELVPYYLLDSQKVYGSVHLLQNEGGGKPLKAGIFLDGFIEAGIDMTLQMVKQDGNNFVVKAMVSNPDLAWTIKNLKVTLNEPAANSTMKTGKCGNYLSYGSALSHGYELTILADTAVINQGCEDAPLLPGPKPTLVVETEEPRDKPADAASSKKLVKAGTHPDLRVTVGRCQDGDILNVDPKLKCKNPEGTDHVPVEEIAMSFPDGFVGSPIPTVANSGALASATCTKEQADKDNCPSSSQVGKVKTWIQAMSNLAMFEAEGTVNAGLPPEGKVARLYYVLKLPEAAGSTASNPKFLTIAFDLDFGLKTGYKVVGSGTVPTDFDIRWMQVELFGNLESYSRPFLRLPTQCDWGQFTVDLYGDDGSKGNASQWFQAKQCSTQTYKPHSEVSVEPSAAFANVKLNIEASFPKDNADSKEVEYLLPSGFTINDSIELNYCKEEDAAKFNCPPQTAAADVVAKTPLLLPSASGSVKKYGPVYGKAYFVEQPKVDDPMKMAVLLDNGLIKARLDTELKMVKAAGTYRVKARVENPLQAPVSLLTLLMSEKVIRTPVVPSSCPAQFKVDAAYTPFAWELGAIKSPSVSLMEAPSLTLTQGCGVPGPSGGAGGASFEEAGKATPEEEDCTPTDDAPQCGFNPSHEVISSDKRAGKTPQSFKIKVTKPAHNFNLASFNLWLPRGFAGNVTATPKCNLQDAQAAAAKKLDEACDQATKVGDVWVTARKTKNELITEKGSLYNAEAAPGKPGRLITYVKLPAILDNETVLIASDVEVKGKAERIYTTVDMPDELESMVNIVGMEIELKGDTNSSGTGPFLMNQTDSNWAELYSEYSGQWGWAKSFSHPYVATEADKLAFAPSFDVASSNSKAGAATTISTSIKQPFGEAAAKRMEVSIGMPVDLGKVPSQCTPAQASAWACPAGSRIADIEAGSWLLPQPLSGTINFGQNGKAYIFLKGFIDVFFEGKIEISAKSGSSTLVVDGLPPMPVTRIEAKNITLFKNPKETPCKPAIFELKTSSHSGRSALSRRELDVCPKGAGEAKLKVKLKPVKRKKATSIRADFSLGQPAAIKGFKLSLGKGKKSLKYLPRLMRSFARSKKKGRPVGKVVVTRGDGSNVSAKLIAKGKKILIKAKKSGGIFKKKAVLKLKKNVIEVKGLLKKAEVSKIRLTLDGRKGRFIRNPKKKGQVSFLAVTSLAGGGKAIASDKVKIK